MDIDVFLLLEGTYPYVRGGVSSWIHRLLLGMPDIRFGIIFLGSQRSDYDEIRYELPKNLVHIEEHWLVEAWRLGKPKDRPGKQEEIELSERVHNYFKDPEAGVDFEDVKSLLTGLDARDGLMRDDFLYSRAVWKNIRSKYLDNARALSFVDYFWTVRIMHAPMFLLAEITRTAPPARLYHSISTGYAGLLGAYLRHATGRPYVLTEHGIYTKERRIDLTQATWIKDAPAALGHGMEDDTSYVRRLWVRFFEGIGRLGYDAADPITSLYEGNRLRQLQDGAAEERTLVVANGIDLERFAPLRERRTKEVPKVLGLIGRVVPIKDIKTFIRAMRTVVSADSEAQGWIVGPEDEDEKYASECHDLVATLGLQDHVQFLGFQDLRDILPQLGVIVLSSISEAMPLVVVEGFAAGVPSVVTDVGACRELIEGRLEEDRALGQAGRVVSIADPEALGHAALELLTDEDEWHRAQAAAIKRVETYYTEPMMIGRYRDIYEEAWK